jgi:hypothetical protein
MNDTFEEVLPNFGSGSFAIINEFQASTVTPIAFPRPYCASSSCGA